MEKLYVTMSRVKSSYAIKLYVKDNMNIDTSGVTLEGVYTNNIFQRDIGYDIIIIKSKKMVEVSFAHQYHLPRLLLYHNLWQP